eukprot:6197654-Pleurochrysis_carterae.AAC.1
MAAHGRGVAYAAPQPASPSPARRQPAAPPPPRARAPPESIAVANPPRPLPGAPRPRAPAARAPVGPPAPRLCSLPTRPCPPRRFVDRYRPRALAASRTLTRRRAAAVLSMRVLTGRGLRVPPCWKGTSRLGGLRPAEGAAPSRACVRRPRRGRAKA